MNIDKDFEMDIKTFKGIYDTLSPQAKRLTESFIHLANSECKLVVKSVFKELWKILDENKVIIAEDLWELEKKLGVD